ncbi:PP2C family serine/threonine-protein phosphatase [Kistimonas scapharcae]|uniref:PP2C family serine/threonine-protein phosphatase n=1 Tax=Kistimonas scapharcae TaxID=1036133 RepID=UPI0031EE85A5
MDAFYNALVMTSVKMTHCYTGDDGSTAAIFLYHREHLYACNIGDSTTLLITPTTGTVKQLSAEELMTEKATARRVALYGGTLNADTAPGHEKVLGVRCTKGVPQLSMSSAFGDPYYGGALTARANVGRTSVKSLQGNKHLVICYSDGVSEVDSVGNIGAFICENYTKHGCMKKVTKDLAEQVFRSGSSDNITVLGWLLDLEQTGTAS